VNEGPVALDGATWAPTHRSPRTGVSAWTAPDGASPAPALDPLLELQVIDRRGDWAHVACSNGWTTWVDGRLLEPLVELDPRDDELVQAGGRTIDAYRTLLADLVAGRIDTGAFQRAAFSAGFMPRQDDAYMFDLDRGCWARYDGITVVFGPALDRDDAAGASPEVQQ
jgi:hypothetical protein